MDTHFFRNELYQMRENYKNNPLTDIKLSRPKWLDSDAALSEIYSQKSALLQRGEIVYASIVQANTLLFKSFPPFNCPAEIIYSTNTFVNENPEYLFDIAQNLYNYKDEDLNTIPEEWREIARVITDKYDRTDFTFSIQLNGNLAEYNMIPTMIYRKLLPKGKLMGTLLPVLNIPETKRVLILPKQYWTKNFTKQWVSGII